MQELYLHGFASSPRSSKAVAFAAHRPGLECLDLRVPSFEHLRLSAMIDVTRRAIRGPAVLIGSSLGGLTAARVAEQDARVEKLVLLAPAFQLATRWRQQLGAELAEWQRTGWREVLDHASQGTARVDHGFSAELEALDVGYPDVRVPTLILHGIHDEAVPIEHSRRFAAGRGHVELIELDDDHQLLRSIPRLLAETDRFLG